MILAPEGSGAGTLRIPVAQERDAGIYTCRAVNELGDASAEIRLEVGRECTPVPTCPHPCSALSGERQLSHGDHQCGICVLRIQSMWDKNVRGDGAHITSCCASNYPKTLA